MIESIFYLCLEYAVAPIGLMIFLFYVKHKSTDKTRHRGPKFGENGIESLFIASYSHILFYFSLSAHCGDHVTNVVGNAKAASLMMAVLGLILIYILKFYSEQWGENHPNTKMATNNSATFSIIFLVVNILYFKHDGWFIRWDILKHLPTKITDIIYNCFLYPNSLFILKPQNLLFLVSAIGLIIIYVKLLRSEGPFKKSVQIYSRDRSAMSTEQLYNKIYDPVIEDEETPWSLKVDALMLKARSNIQKNEIGILESELLEVRKAHRISIENDSPLNQIYGIDKLQIEILCRLGRIEEAHEVIAKWNKLYANEENANKKLALEMWIKILNDLVNRFSENGNDIVA